MTPQTARKSLTAHVAEKGAEIHAKYGPRIGWNELVRVLEDPTCVRYPCRIEFGATELQPGEFAFPVAVGERPEDGFTMYVHPLFMARLDAVPALVFYQLVLVNYGAFAAAADAEAFGAAALGLDREEYYARVCDLADQVALPEDPGAECGS